MAVLILMINSRLDATASLMSFFKPIIQSTSLLQRLALQEIRQQYVGSALGMVWQLITPLILIAVFWVVFSVGFRIQPESGVPFVVWLTAGMAAWFCFAEVVSGSVQCITQSPHLVKKVVFPVQTLPLVKVLVASSNHLVFGSILVALILINQLPISWYFLQGVYYFFCMVCLGLGLGWMLAALNVLSRDTARLTSVLLQVGMWATPILWDIKILPEPYRSLFAINPMYYVVQGYRDSFLYATPVIERASESVLFWSITGTMVLLGIYLFRRLQPQFADLV